jgi:tRNA (guanine37-N1)-methyltransferase
VTIFPEYFGDETSGPLRTSLIGKAAARGDIDFRIHDLRRWAPDVHHTVDDVPFGGGPGMVMKPDVWGAALDEILTVDAAPDRSTADCPTADYPTAGGPLAGGSLAGGSLADCPTAGGPTAGGSLAGGSAGSGRLVVPTPSGVPFTQALASHYAAQSRLIFACGRYEGIDGRVVDHMRQRMPVDEISLGDYVLAGGEAAVLVMVEAVGRLLPGVLGNASSADDDSFGGAGGSMTGLLEGPVYTRPRTWRGHEVPEILLSGNHAAIARWRRDMALRRTAAHRPDLLATLELDARDRQVLAAGFPVSGQDMAH